MNPPLTPSLDVGGPSRPAAMDTAGHAADGPLRRVVGSLVPELVLCDVLRTGGCHQASRCGDHQKLASPRLTANAGGGRSTDEAALIAPSRALICGGDFRIRWRGAL